MNALGIVGIVVAAVAALIHVYIFALESLLWSRPSTQRTFGVTDAHDGEVLRSMAYNQGFYNLFLAIGTAAGIVLMFTATMSAPGFAVTVFALASMLLAALVLVTANRRMVRPALIQGGPPLVALVFLVAGALAA
jgi:putative membrane protein